MNHYSDLYEHCTLCPRMCGVNRHIRTGLCGCSSKMAAARAALHFWEEPCISGNRGSGAVFFSGCTLKCCFCQNYSISQEGAGKEITPSRLEEIILKLQDKGAQNIDLITATQYLPTIIPVLEKIRGRLRIPVVYNCGGYERVETLRLLDGLIDVYLPDLKYYSPEVSGRYSKASDYFAYAGRAVKEMIRQTRKPVFSQEGILTKGVLIRHMVLPGQKEDSLRLLHWMAEELPKKRFLFSLMSQYTPFYKASEYPEINRRITSYEYQKVWEQALYLGLDQGYMQRRTSAREEYTPPFDLEGL